MRRVRIFNGVIIAGYAGVVILLAFFLLLDDRTLLFRLHNRLPLIFILRFCIFWFLCFTLALAVFLLNLRLNYFRLSLSDELYALRLSKLVLIAGVTGGVLLLAGYFYYE